MNFLAHSYLSFSEEQLVGNMIADFVKNRDIAHLPEGIQKGIRLHRAIDTFTDAHPVIHEAKEPFRPLVRLYSGAFVDVSFDYFLANDRAEKSQKEWQKYSKEVYAVISKYEKFLPDVFKIVFERMKKDDWLYNYRYDWGIEFSFRNVVNKAKFLDKNTDVFPIFMTNKDFFREKYEIFFPEIKSFAQNFVI